MKFFPQPDKTNEDYKEFCNNIDLTNNNICFFLGAGFSKQLGFKTWSELISELIDEFWKLKISGASMNPEMLFNWSIKNRLLSQYNKLYIMDYLYKLNTQKYYEIIERIFKENESKSRSDTIDIFKSLVFENRVKFIQTNIDVTFETYNQIKQTDISINPGSDEHSKLIYLHGRIDKRDSWIFRQEEYFENYLNSESNLSTVLIEIFSKYTVIFVGYSLNDYEIWQAIAKSRINSKGNPKKHYVLIPACELYKTEVLVNSFIYKNYGIYFLEYDIESDGYDILGESLKELVGIIKPGTGRVA
jgi:NAD-dependent SIR2 family protein deacetylase